MHLHIFLRNEICGYVSETWQSRIFAGVGEVSVAGVYDNFGVATAVTNEIVTNMRFAGSPDHFLWGPPGPIMKHLNFGRVIERCFICGHIAGGKGCS